MELKDRKDRDIIHISTEKEWGEISKLLIDNRFKWSSGASYRDKFWSKVISKDYEIGLSTDGYWASIDYYKENEFNIIPASLFLESNYEIY